jgi:hypothetical protein
MRRYLGLPVFEFLLLAIVAIGFLLGLILPHLH